MIARKAKTDDTGTFAEVKPGDTIQDFRGDSWIFVRATRVQEVGRSGKVLVRPLDSDAGREYYDKVFDLVVTEN